MIQTFFDHLFLGNWECTVVFYSASCLFCLVEWWLRKASRTHANVWLCRWYSCFPSFWWLHWHLGRCLALCPALIIAHLSCSATSIRRFLTTYHYFLLWANRLFLLFFPSTHHEIFRRWHRDQAIEWFDSRFLSSITRCRWSFKIEWSSRASSTHRPKSWWF